MEPVDFQALRQVLAEEGFVDLDSYSLAKFLCFFAEALREAPLESFGAVNDRIGTANGLASGIVRLRMDQLDKLGYIDVSLNDDVHLTARGASAARVLGVATD